MQYGPRWLDTGGRGTDPPTCSIRRLIRANQRSRITAPTAPDANEALRRTIATPTVAPRRLIAAGVKRGNGRLVIQGGGSVNANAKAALEFLAQLQHLDAADTDSDPHQDPAVRVTIRTASGEFVGEALLSLRAAEEGASAVSAATGFALRDQARGTAPEAPAGDIDPLLIAQLEDHFEKVDPDSLLADVFDSEDAEASLAAFEQLVTGEFDIAQLDPAVPDHHSPLRRHLHNETTGRGMAPAERQHTETSPSPVPRED